jgi:hypothetical protein
MYTEQTNANWEKVLTRLDALIAKKSQPEPAKVKPKPAAVAHKKPIKHRPSKSKAYKETEITDYDTYINEVVKSPEERRKEANPYPYPVTPQQLIPEGYKPIGDHNKAYWNPVTGDVIGPKR